MAGAGLAEAHEVHLIQLDNMKFHPTDNAKYCYNGTAVYSTLNYGYIKVYKNASISEMPWMHILFIEELSCSAKVYSRELPEKYRKNLPKD
jgi:hypothetical protein